MALIVVNDTDGVVAMEEEAGLDLALHLESGDLGQVRPSLYIYICI